MSNERVTWRGLVRDTPTIKAAEAALWAAREEYRLAVNNAHSRRERSVHASVAAFRREEVAGARLSRAHRAAAKALAEANGLDADDVWGLYL